MVGKAIAGRRDDIVLAATACVVLVSTTLISTRSTVTEEYGLGVLVWSPLGGQLGEVDVQVGLVRVGLRVGLRVEFVGRVLTERHAVFGQVGEIWARYSGSTLSRSAGSWRTTSAMPRVLWKTTALVSSELNFNLVGGRRHPPAHRRIGEVLQQLHRAHHPPDLPERGVAGVALGPRGSLRSSREEDSCPGSPGAKPLTVSRSSPLRSLAVPQRLCRLGPRGVGDPDA